MKVAISAIAILKAKKKPTEKYFVQINILSV